MTQDPYAPPNAPLQKAALMESDFLKAFVCFILCAVIGGMLGGALIGGMIGIVWGLTGSTGPALHTPVLILAGLTGLIINYFVFRFFVTPFIVSKLARELGSAA